MNGASAHASIKVSRMSSAVRADDRRASVAALQEVPSHIAYTSPTTSTIPARNDGGSRPATTLPLHLIAHIVSYLDDVGDLARISRTSKLMYYMSLPQLYRRVSLHSYGEMRYVNGKPEGFGAASPFMMALNGLCTKGHASLIEDFRIWGQWQELGIDDFARGRVPDSSMMLNIIARTATDKMSKLKSFSWELNCKPLKTLYQGLGTHSTLTSLTLRFPSTRIPRPSVLVPPMVNLRVFKALDIDPLCYPDDISLLMLESKKLQDVRLHFSPRMRAEAESVMNLNTFFGRCHKAGYKMKIKHFGMQNWFGPNVLSFEKVFDTDIGRSATFIDTFGGTDPRTIFVDDTWNDVPSDNSISFERVRFNEFSKTHADLMRQARPGTKYFYLVSNARRQKSGFTPSSNGSNITPPTLNQDPNHSPYDPTKDPEMIALGTSYIQMLGRKHGATLKHVLLSDLWAISRKQLADLLIHCPHLEQLGIAVDDVFQESIRSLCPLLPKLKILRVLENEQLRQHFTLVSDDERRWLMGCDIASMQETNLEFVCLGEVCYKVGKMLEYVADNGTFHRRCEITRVDKSEAMKYEIWYLDTLDISVDPIDADLK